MLDRAISLVESRRVATYQLDGPDEAYAEMLKEVRRGLIRRSEQHG